MAKKRNPPRRVKVWRNLMRKVQVVPGVVFEIDPNKKYLLILPRGSLTMDEASKLKMPNDSMIAVVRGDPAAVRMVEAPFTGGGSIK